MRDMTNSDPKEDKPATRKNPADNAYRSEVQDEAHKLIESASRLRRAAELYYRRQNAISWARDHREDDS